MQRARSCSCRSLAVVLAVAPCSGFGLVPAALAARGATEREAVAIRDALASYLRAQHASAARFVTYPTCMSTARPGFAVAWTWLVENGRLLDAPLPSYAGRKGGRWRTLVFMTQNPPAPVPGLPASAKRELDFACRLTSARRAEARRLFSTGKLPPARP